MNYILPAAMALSLAPCLSAGAAPARASQPGPLRVGIAAADITPEGPAWLRGYAGRNTPSDGVSQKLLAQCVLFDNGQTRVALVALDLCILSHRQLIKLRRAAEAAGIPQQHLMVNVSHTHWAPGLETEANLEYEALFTERTQPLFAAAVADLKPALLDYAVGISVVGINRRQLKPDGTYRGGPEPRKPIDMDVPVLRVLDAQGRARAVIFGYACHPTTGAGRMMNIVHSDYPGYARDWIGTAYPGAEPIFLQGCGGDVKTRVVRPGVPGVRDGRGEFHWVILGERDAKAMMGYEMGRAVLAAGIIPPPPVPTDRPLEPEAALATPVPLGGIVEAVSLPSKTDPAQKGPMLWLMGAWRIGDLYFSGSQGEILSAIGRHIKARMPDVRVWTCGYTHWGGGYFADAASYPEGGYEVNNSSFGPQAEGILVDNAVRYVRELQTNPIHTAPIPRCSP
ncbi:MAG: hypothetical protein HY321_13950 [Armatimonadetes bacterium]|nr:hypothetical protein [Armatimonadota bacterium]